MNKFTCVLLLGTALLAGCVDREGYYNSVREEDSHGLTSLRGQPELRYNDDWSRWPRVYGATALYPLYASAYYELVPEPKIRIEPRWPGRRMVCNKPEQLKPTIV